eukprot:TRINITY_DN27321_c0_g1_i1.p1 TRINITY_DN27321_c0_g1~~TRINITY_DN27321_c0_g1_i1.p1  ORF type:complete len:331 (+),score=123.88 TRINITY_DN27321_c0_g1_i1:80-994(+)
MERPIVIPGELLTTDAKNWLHGKGTYQNADGQLLSGVCGEVQMMDRMVRVEPGLARYVGATGDCVVGRVISVGMGRWKVDVGSHLDAALLLQNVNLPGGHLRRKTTEDARQMRELFSESDMFSGEVQKVNRDGSLSLHTRSARYGKLPAGMLVTVPAVLVKRLSTHFHVFDCGIEALIGVNGFIWLSMARRKKRKRAEIEAGDSDDEKDEKKNPLQTKAPEDDEGPAAPFTPFDRVNAARLRAAILVLSEAFLEVSPATISLVYAAAVTHGLRPADMHLPEHRATLVQPAMDKLKGIKGPKPSA